MNTFETDDIILASVLKLRGYVLEKIVKTGNKGKFIFTEVPPEIITNFDLGNIRVEPVAFNNALKALTTSTRRMS